MTPEDVMGLIKGGLDYRQLLGAERVAQSSTASAAAQNQVENYYKALNARLAMGKDARDAESIKINQPYERDGKMVQDTHDSTGRLISREVVGDPKPQFASRVFEGPDGNLQFIPNGMDIPPGFKEPTNRTLDMTEAQKDNRKLKLAGIEQMITNMKDSKGGELSPEAVQGYAEYYNQNANAPYKFKMLPKGPGYFGSSPEWIKLPTNPAERAKLPDATLNRLLPVGSDGKQITMEQVRKIAKAKGATVAEAIQLLIKD